MRQPNGLLGRFSDIVDDFTHINMTHDEAIDVCLEDLGRHEAAEKVRRGEDDDPIWGNEKPCPEKLMRWKDSLSTIRSIHGESWAEIRKRECSETPDAEVVRRGDE